jgi:hypothetical protein
MSKPKNKVSIPLPEKEALSLLLKVKPTAEMPRLETSKAKKPPK